MELTDFELLQEIKKISDSIHETNDKETQNRRLGFLLGFIHSLTIATPASDFVVPGSGINRKSLVQKLKENRSKFTKGKGDKYWESVVQVIIHSL